MAALDFIKSLFGKLDDIVYEPVKTACRRFEAPLVQQRHDHKVELADQTAHHAAEADERAARQKQTDSDLEIALKRADAEIEEIKRSGEFARHKELHDTILSYQQRLVELRHHAFKQAGELHQDLVRSANSLIDERHQRLTDFMDRTRAKMYDELDLIDTRFANNPARQEALGQMVMENVHNVLKQAEVFIGELTHISRNLGEGIAALNEENRVLLAAQGGHIESLSAYYATGSRVQAGTPPLPEADTPEKRLPPSDS